METQTQERRTLSERYTTPTTPIPSTDWGAAVKAGLLSGLIFLILEMIMVPLFLGGSPWGPPSMIAAIVMGQGVLPPPPTFDLGVVLAAMVVHFALSVAFAVALAFILTRLKKGAALLTGGIFGLGLYVVNFYLFTALFPWFANARNWVSIFTHIVFGLLAAWFYVKWARPRTATA